MSIECALDEIACHVCQQVLYATYRELQWGVRADGVDRLFDRLFVPMCDALVSSLSPAEIQDLLKQREAELAGTAAE